MRFETGLPEAYIKIMSPEEMTPSRCIKCCSDALSPCQKVIKCAHRFFCGALFRGMCGQWPPAAPPPPSSRPPLVEAPYLSVPPMTLPVSR